MDHHARNAIFLRCALLCHGTIKILIPWYLKVRLCTSLESHCELRRGIRFFVALPVSNSFYLEHIATVANYMCIPSSTNAARQI